MTPIKPTLVYRNLFYMGLSSLEDRPKRFFKELVGDSAV